MLGSNTSIYKVNASAVLSPSLSPSLLPHLYPFLTLKYFTRINKLILNQALINTKDETHIYTKNTLGVERYYSREFSLNVVNCTFILSISYCPQSPLQSTNCSVQSQSTNDITPKRKINKHFFQSLT